MAKIRPTENRPEIALSRSGWTCAFASAVYRSMHAEPHRFADDGFGDRYPTLAVELHPAAAFGDQEAVLEVRVGDVLADVRVIEAHGPPGDVLA